MQKNFPEEYKEIKKFLDMQGINSSHQRVIIFKYLAKNFIHPTADTIYESLKDNNPTLSKTTVYNTLKLFTKKGILKELPIEGNEMRYDINTEPHIHFKCIKCGEVFDIFDNDLLQTTTQFNTINGHTITEFHILLKGICKNCK